jgi:plastocyanin
MTSPRTVMALALSLALSPAALAAEGKSSRKRDRQSESAAKRERPGEDAAEGSAGRKQESPSGDNAAEHARLQKEIDQNRAVLKKLLQQQRDQADQMLRMLQQKERGGGTETPAATATPEPARTADPAPREEPARAERSSDSGSARPRGGSGVLTGKVTIEGGGPMAEAVVYLVDVKGRLAKNNTLTIKQVNKQFVPRVAVVPRGTKLELPNEDTIFHNAFSLSPGNAFDLGTYRAGDQPGAVTLNTPGVVKIFCNIHSQMSASVLVAPSNLFAQVKPDGTFRISGIPPGRHQVAAWTPNGEPVVRDVEVQPGDNEPVAFTVSGRAGQAAHTNKFGQPYGSYAE